MPYYSLEGMNLIEGVDDAAGSCNARSDVSGQLRSTADEQCSKISDETICNDFEISMFGQVCEYTPAPATGEEKKEPEPIDEGTAEVDTPEDTTKADITDTFNKLMGTFDNTDISKIIKKYIPEKAYIHANKDLNTMSILNVKDGEPRLSFLDLGKPENEKYLNSIESIILNFLDLPDSEVITFYKQYCNEDINVEIFLGVAILFNNANIFNNTSSVDLMNITRLSNRLLKYVPGILHKILIGLKNCDSNSNKYLIIDNIYSQLFKYNTTNVNLNLFSGFTSVMDYLKNLKTVEMIIAIIAIAFVLSKIFDMFRVKVEV